MIKLIKGLIDDKKTYKQQLSRVEKLPEDYQFVFRKICEYIWGYASGSGRDMLVTQGKLIDLFCEGAELNIPILELTGTDVASFCDELIIDTKKWTDIYSQKLNKNIITK